jgi:hypothetical protein
MKNASSSDCQEILFLRSVLRLLATADVYRSPILVILMMEAIRASETSVLTRIIWRHIPEDGILHNRRPEDLKSYEKFPYIRTLKNFGDVG